MTDDLIERQWQPTEAQWQFIAALTGAAPPPLLDSQPRPATTRGGSRPEMRRPLQYTNQKTGAVISIARNDLGRCAIKWHDGSEGFLDYTINNDVVDIETIHAGRIKGGGGCILIFNALEVAQASGCTDVEVSTYLQEAYNFYRRLRIPVEKGSPLGAGRVAISSVIEAARIAMSDRGWAGVETPTGAEA